MKRSLLILAALVALGCGIVAGPAYAENVVTAPDGTVTLVSGLQYMQVFPDGSHTPLLDYASPESEEDGDPAVAVAPDGTATIVWKRVGIGGTKILSRRIAPDGELGAIEELGHSELPYVDPEVATAADGAATAAWVSTNSESQTEVQAIRIAPDGAPQEEPYVLATRSSYEVDVAVSPGGTATIAWLQFGDDRSQAAARQISAGGVLGETLELSSGVGSADAPEVVATPGGAAVLAWSVRYWNGAENPPDEVIEERRIAADGKLDGAVNVLSEPDARAPRLASGPDGTVTIVWTQRSSAGALKARRIAPGGAPEASVIDVSSPVAGGIFPEIAIAADGSATIVWDDMWRLFSRRLDPEGAPLGAPLELLKSNGHLDLIGMGLYADGTALPIWTRRLGYPEPQLVLQAERLPPDGGAGPIFNLTPPSTEPATAAKPESLDFGSVAIGSTEVRTVEFTNATVDPVSVEDVVLQGKDAGQFAILDDTGCTAKPLPFVSTCAVTVAFTPSANGAKKAELALEAMAPREPRVVSLAGLALPPAKGDPPGPPPKSAAGASGPVSAEDAELSIAGVEIDRQRGTATLSLELPAAGDLEAVASCAASRRAGRAPARLLAQHSGAGQVEVPVKARGLCERSLDRNGAVRLRIAVRFASAGGGSSEAVRSLVLKRQSGAQASARARTRG